MGPLLSGRLKVAPSSMFRDGLMSSIGREVHRRGSTTRVTHRIIALIFFAARL